MKRLSELTMPVWAPEAEGNGGAANAAPASADTQPAAAAADTLAGGAGADTQPAGAAEAPKADWRDRRIASLTAQLAQAKKAPAQAAPTASPTPDPTADFNARVNAAAAEQAARLVAVGTFTERCNAVAKIGSDTYGKAEFATAMRGIQALVDPDETGQANYTDFLETVIETGKGADLLFSLGSDLDEAQRILELSPRKRAIELAQRATTLGLEAEPSRAPKPIRVVEAKGARHDSVQASDARSDNLPTSEWMARRNAEVAANAGGNR